MPGNGACPRPRRRRSASARRCPCWIASQRDFGVGKGYEATAERSRSMPTRRSRFVSSRPSTMHSRSLSRTSGSPTTLGCARNSAVRESSSWKASATNSRMSRPNRYASLSSSKLATDRFASFDLDERRPRDAEMLRGVVLGHAAGFTRCPNSSSEFLLSDGHRRSHARRGRPAGVNASRATCEPYPPRNRSPRPRRRGGRRTSSGGVLGEHPARQGPTTAAGEHATRRLWRVSEQRGFAASAGPVAGPARGACGVSCWPSRARPGSGRGGA